MKKIINVKALNDFALECTMDNGDVFRYNMSFVLDGPGEMLTALRKPSHFKKVFIELGSLSWPSGYEIHAETVARDGELIERQAS